MPESVRFEANRVLTVLPRGGELFTQSVQKITPQDLDKLENCALRWPEENAEAIQLIRQLFSSEPATRQWIACDTAFFTGLPRAAAEYALPQELTAHGLRRFGADGLFHNWVAQHIQNAERLVSVHLCGSTTLAAIRNGVALDTSAGYSQLEGLPGLTTCGDIDPSLVLYLRDLGYSFGNIRELLYAHSGWQSFCKEPLTYEQLISDNRSETALPGAIYFHCLIKQLGSMLAVLGGADHIVLGAESASLCENLVEKIRCHFTASALSFELIEINREEILKDLLRD